MKVLNLYAGLGGNRKLWTGCQVTAVELDPRIAAVYARQHPQDTVIVGDAHQYLLDHHQEFDFVWSSPPCPTHSKMMKCNSRQRPKYPDMGLYQEVIFLTHFFKGKWVVENVKSYYTPLIAPQVSGRHFYWANFNVGTYAEPSPKNFIKLQNAAAKQSLMDWLGIHYPESICCGNSHDPTQPLRNCVHPNEGLAIMRAALGQQEPEQLSLIAAE